jgi:hypothetical protein
LHQTTNLNFIAFPQTPFVPGNMVKKKLTLKERILLKWYKKKISRSVSEEKEKKTIKILGNLSLGAAILAPILFLVSYAISAFSLWVLSFIFVPAAIILGLIALSKRKKLADNTDVNRTPALIGLIIGLILLIIPLLFLLIFSIAYSG